MRPVEKNVVPHIALASQLDHGQPLDGLEKPVAMISQLNFMKPEYPPAVPGVFQEADGVVFQKIGESEDFAGVALSGDEPLMK